jgi:hypothetical protein
MGGTVVMEEIKIYVSDEMDGNALYVDDGTDGLFITLRTTKSKLVINDGDIIIESPRPLPNWWYRMWYKILLGWKWENV